MRRYLPLIQAILCLVAFFWLQVMVGCRRLASTNPGETTSNIRAATTRKVWYGFDFANTHDWTYLNRRGDNSNSEQQCYLPARIGLSSGLLTITAQVSTQTCSDTTNGTASFNFSSGFLQLSTINFVSGTLSARIKFTGGSGPWPAFWLLGSNCQATNPNTADNTGSCNWPQTSANSDEIDIAEILGSTLTQVNQQIHADSNTGACAGQCLVTTSDVSAGFHVYTLVRVEIGR